MEWYEQWFNEHYRMVYPHRDVAEAELQLKLLGDRIPLAEVGTACDIACGEGRQAILLAERIPEVWGIDLSEVFLANAEKLVKHRDSKLKLMRADMRQLPFDRNYFDLICNFFTGFGYFDSRSEHEELLKEWARVTKPGGHFVLDYFNEPFLRNNLKGETITENDQFVIVQKRHLSEQKQRVEKTISITDISSGEEKNYKESVALFSPDELRLLLAGAGFTIASEAGDYHGEPYSEQSERLIIFSRKSL